MEVMIRAEWTDVTDKFSMRTHTAYTQINGTFGVLFDVSRDVELFQQLDQIMSMTQRSDRAWDFTEKATLMQQLRQGTSQPDKQRQDIDRLMAKSLSKLGHRHLQGLKEMKGLNRKISKHLEKLQKPDGLSDSSLQELTGDIRGQLEELSSFVEHNSLVLACLDIKLGELSGLNKKMKVLFSKLVKATWKLVRSFPTTSTSDSISLDLSEKQRESETHRNEGQITVDCPKVRLIQVQPWKPAEDYNGHMEGACRQSDRGTFAPTLITKDSASPRDDVSLLEYVAPDPTPRRTPTPSQDPMGYENGTLTNVPVPAFEGPDPRPAPRTFFRRKVAPALGYIAPLGMRTDVYVRVTQPYTAQNRAELSLRVGQTLKQKMAAKSDGLAYGWTRVHRLTPKRWGFYPVSCVELAPHPPR